MNKSKNSRREFGVKLAALTSVGLASCQTPSAFADQLFADQLLGGHDALEANVFQRLLGERFIVADGQSSFVVRLEDVQIQCAKRTCRPETLRRKTAFTILFAPVDGQLIEQAVCRVTHPQIGEQEIFLVPVDGTGKVEAVFA